MKKSKRTNIIGCTIFTRKKQKVPLFYFPESKHTMCFVNLEQYLICPLEFVPKAAQEIIAERARKRWRNGK
jgi:hypothetical protein